MAIICGMQQVVFKNRIALFQWMFAAAWLSMLAAMTRLSFTDGVPDGTSPALLTGILMLFWLGGAGLVAYVSSKPCTTVSVGRDSRISCTRRYPFRVRHWRLGVEAVSPAAVVEASDDEGDPYFYARIVGDEESFDIAESHSREHCEAVCAAFNRALGK